MPMIHEVVYLSLIATGGVDSGAALAAALCLDTEAVQAGCRFAATIESSACE